MQKKLTAAEKMQKFAKNVVDTEVDNLVTLQLNLTDFCVCKCKGCEHWKWPNKKKLDLATLEKNVFPYFKSSKTLQSVVFSGGEPLLHPQIEKIVSIISREYGKKVGIITSGLGKVSIDWKTLSENCSWIRFSSDGFTQDNYAETRGVNMFDTWTKNLKTLYNYNKDTSCKSRINITIHEYNIDNFSDNLLEFLEENQLFMPVYFWLSREYIDQFRKVFSQKAEDIIMPDEVDKIGKKMASLKVIAKSKGYMLDWTNVVRHFSKHQHIHYRSCYVPQIFLLTACDGNVFPCCYMYEPVFAEHMQQKQYVVGNINDQSIDEILNSDKYKSVVKEFRECEKKFPQCKFCDRFDHINKYLNDYIEYPIFL